MEIENNIPTQQSDEVPSELSNNSSSQKRMIIIAGVIVCLLILAAVYFLGTKKGIVQQGDQLAPSPIPSTAIVATITIEPTISTNISPASDPTITQQPKESTKIISIPSSWKKYSGEDTDFGIKTTLSLPLGYTFGFSGSEWTISNSDSTELWDYSSSVYSNNDGVLKNYYDGSSRRAWYGKRLSETRSLDKIIKVTEKPLNNTSYLEITVQTPSYNDHGETSGTRNEIHYVYVQNNILHMIVPASIKATSAAAEIPKNIEPILVSLISIQTN